LGNDISLRGFIACRSGRLFLGAYARAPAADAAQLGAEIGRQLTEMAGPDFLR
jgi:hypothetical protein